MSKCTETVNGVTIYPIIKNGMQSVQEWFQRPCNTPSTRLVVFDIGECPMYREYSEEVVGFVTSVTRHHNEVCTYTTNPLPQYEDVNVRCTTFKDSHGAFFLHFDNGLAHFNDIPCATCGLFSKSVLICSRCWKRRYCSVKCQSDDWETSHRDDCVHVCRSCGIGSEEDRALFQCSRCKWAYYCGPECQRMDRKKHAYWCHDRKDGKSIC